MQASTLRQLNGSTKGIYFGVSVNDGGGGPQVFILHVNPADHHRRGEKPPPYCKQNDAPKSNRNRQRRVILIVIVLHHPVSIQISPNNGGGASTQKQSLQQNVEAPYIPQKNNASRRVLLSLPCFDVPDPAEYALIS